MAEEIIEGNTPEIGTELDVAAKFWGKELALENGEELPEEDNQLEPESESEEESSDISYKSINDGIMHACGHDGHTAMLLGVAEVLAKKVNDINGKVKFLFQIALLATIPLNASANGLRGLKSKLNESSESFFFILQM